MSDKVSSDSSLQLPDWLVDMFRPMLAWQPMLCLLALVSFLIAWNRGIALLYGLFVLVVATWILSYLMPRLHLRGLRVQRQLPTELFAGEQGVIEYSVKAPGRRYQLTLLDHLPFKARPEEPLRTFALDINRQQLVQQTVICEKRGKYSVEGITVACAYPFGMVTVKKQLTTERNDILVLPKLFKVSHLPFISAEHTASDGIAISQRQGTIDEFAGIREYRRGDSIKYMHWPATAKYQVPIVKEYDSQDKPRLLIILDSDPNANVGRGAHSTFEYAIQITASLMTYASQHGYISQLVTSHHEANEMTVPAYSHDLIPCYERLALLEADSHSHHGRYTAMVDYAQQRYPHSNIIITFRNQSDKTIPFIKPGVTHIDMQMLDHSFAAAIFQAPDFSQQGERVTYSVSYGMDMETLFV